MFFEWQCVKCDKIYPQDCEGAVYGGFYPFQPYLTIKCQCGGDLKICPIISSASNSQGEKYVIRCCMSCLRSEVESRC